VSGVRLAAIRDPSFAFGFGNQTKSFVFLTDLETATPQKRANNAARKNLIFTENPKILGKILYIDFLVSYGQKWKDKL
jgi:hypothetical protein